MSEHRPSRFAGENELCRHSIREFVSHGLVETAVLITIVVNATLVAFVGAAPNEYWSRVIFWVNLICSGIYTVEVSPCCTAAICSCAACGQGVRLARL